MRGDSGVAGEGRVVGVPKFHSWGKCTMPLTNINSDWMSNASYRLRIILGYIILYYTWVTHCAKDLAPRTSAFALIFPNLRFLRSQST